MNVNRLHEFSKIEIVRIDTPEHSAESHKEMLAHVEGLLQKLELPYRILRLCGGDASFTSAICYDFEVYSEAQQRWLEVSSVSNFDTYQANRLKCRYRNATTRKTELKDIKVWANLDGKGEYQMITPFDKDVDDNASAYPSTGKWGTVNKGPYTIGNTNISMYKTHTVNLRAYIKEDDTTSPDEYAGNLQLIYEPGTGKWSANGNVIDNGGEFVLSLGSAPNAQMLFTLNWTE